MAAEQQWVERDGQRLAVHHYAQPEPDAPAVVIWPAMGVPAGYYRPFAATLAQAGLAVTVVDLRGTGASGPPANRKSRYGYAALVDDVGAVLTAMKPRLDGRRLILLGHSLGGQACLLHLATSGQPADGLALLAVGLPHWRRYGALGLGVLAFTHSIAGTARLAGVWPGWGFGGRQARGVIRDWAYTARTGRFPTLAGEDPQPALAAVRTPVLAVSFQKDWHTPAPVVDHLADTLTAAPVRRVHVHGTADHFTWARDPAGPAAAHVIEFVRSLDEPSAPSAG